MHVVASVCLWSRVRDLDNVEKLLIIRETQDKAARGENADTDHLLRKVEKIFLEEHPHAKRLFWQRSL